MAILSAVLYLLTRATIKPTAATGVSTTAATGVKPILDPRDGERAVAAILAGKTFTPGATEIEAAHMVRPVFTWTHAGRIGTLPKGFDVTAAWPFKRVQLPAGTDFGDFILANGLACGYESVWRGNSSFYASDDAGALFAALSPFQWMAVNENLFTARILVNVTAAEPYKHRWPELFPSQRVQIMDNVTRGRLDTRVVVISVAPLPPAAMRVLTLCYQFAVAKNPVLRRALNGGVDDFIISVRRPDDTVTTLGVVPHATNGSMYVYGLNVTWIDDTLSLSTGTDFVHELIHKYQASRTTAKERAYAHEILSRCDLGILRSAHMRSPPSEAEAYFMSRLLVGEPVLGVPAEYLEYLYNRGSD